MKIYKSGQFYHFKVVPIVLNDAISVELSVWNYLFLQKWLPKGYSNA
jgi:hypothetical protein